MQGNTLNDLLEIYVEGPTLSSFCPDCAVELWWSDCSTTRRVNQQPRKQYRSDCSTTRRVNQQPRKQYLPQNPESSDPIQEEEEEEEEQLTLELWDEWFHESDGREESD